MKKKKILILGSKGFYGKKLKVFLKAKKQKVFSDTRFKELLKNSRVDFYLSKLLLKKPEIIINLVANTDVNFCEKNKNEAKKSNIFFIKKLVKLIQKNNLKVHLIQFSSDQVYSGKGNHGEKNTNPKNFYGLTKFIGEKYARKIPSSVLRLNFIGKSNNKKNLSNWIVKNLQKEKKIHVFKNIFFSPIHVSTLNNLILKIIRNPIIGTFNLGSKNKISKADFAYRLCKYLKLNFQCLKKVDYKKKTFGVIRPLDMSLDVTKFEKTYKIKLPLVEKEINKLINEYK